MTLPVRGADTTGSDADPEVPAEVDQGQGQGEGEGEDDWTHVSDESCEEGTQAA